MILKCTRKLSVITSDNQNTDEQYIGDFKIQIHKDYEDGSGGISDPYPSTNKFEFSLKLDKETFEQLEFGENYQISFEKMINARVKGKNGPVTNWFPESEVAELNGVEILTE